MENKCNDSGLYGYQHMVTIRGKWINSWGVGGDVLFFVA